MVTPQPRQVLKVLDGHAGAGTLALCSAVLTYARLRVQILIGSEGVLPAVAPQSIGQFESMSGYPQTLSGCRSNIKES